MARNCKRVKPGAPNDYWKHDRRPKPRLSGFWHRPAARGEVLVALALAAALRAIWGIF